MLEPYHHHEFAVQLAELETEYPRAREAVRGIQSVLQRNPQCGELVDPVNNGWFIGLPDVFGPPLGILYTFDDTRLILRSIWIDSSTGS